MPTTSSGTNRRYRLAVIPGDGIGKEVIPEGQSVPPVGPGGTDWP